MEGIPPAAPVRFVRVGSVEGGPPAPRRKGEDIGRHAHDAHLVESGPDEVADRIFREPRRETPVHHADGLSGSAVRFREPAPPDDRDPERAQHSPADAADGERPRFLAPGSGDPEHGPGGVVRQEVAVPGGLHGRNRLDPLDEFVQDPPPLRAPRREVRPASAEVHGHHPEAGVGVAAASGEEGEGAAGHDRGGDQDHRGGGGPAGEERQQEGPPAVRAPRPLGDGGRALPEDLDERRRFREPDGEERGQEGRKGGFDAEVPVRREQQVRPVGSQDRQQVGRDRQGAPGHRAGEQDDPDPGGRDFVSGRRAERPPDARGALLGERLGEPETRHARRRDEEQEQGAAAEDLEGRTDALGQLLGQGRQDDLLLVGPESGAPENRRRFGARRGGGGPRGESGESRVGPGHPAARRRNQGQPGHDPRRGEHQIPGHHADDLDALTPEFQRFADRPRRVPEQGGGQVLAQQGGGRRLAVGKDDPVVRLVEEPPGHRSGAERPEHSGAESRGDDEAGVGRSADDAGSRHPGADPGQRTGRLHEFRRLHIRGGGGRAVVAAPASRSANRFDGHLDDLVGVPPRQPAFDGVVPDRRHRVAGGCGHAEDEHGGQGVPAGRDEGAERDAERVLPAGGGEHVCRRRTGEGGPSAAPTGLPVPPAFPGRGWPSPGSARPRSVRPSCSASSSRSRCPPTLRCRRRA